MIKTRCDRTAYEMIDEAIRENGGVPPIMMGSGLPLTRENWDMIQAEIKKRLPEYIKQRKEEILLEDDSKVYNC